MRALANISNLCRVLLGVVLACGLLLLPPSSVHAESGMHDSAQAAHHAGHLMTTHTSHHLYTCYLLGTNLQLNIMMRIAEPVPYLEMFDPLSSLM